MFHLVIQYSLINCWGRAFKNLLNNVTILQNRFLRASLFQTVRTSVKLLYTKFGVLKLEDMIDMKYVKFLFRFCNDMLPLYFNNYSTSKAWKQFIISTHAKKTKPFLTFFWPDRIGAGLGFSAGSEPDCNV